MKDVDGEENRSLFRIDSAQSENVGLHRTPLPCRRPPGSGVGRNPTFSYLCHMFFLIVLHFQKRSIYSVSISIATYKERGVSYKGGIQKGVIGQ